MSRIVVVQRRGCLFGVLIVFLVVLALALLFLNLLTSAFTRIGFTPSEAVLLLLASLIGSRFNIPIARKVSRVPVMSPPSGFGLFYLTSFRPVAQWTTVLAINVGGAVIPILVSGYLLLRFQQAIPLAVCTTAIAAIAINRFAQPIEGVGIGVPALWPPLVTAVTVFAITLIAGGSAESRFVAAYVAGSLGTLIGADLMNLGSISDMGAAVASIGGAGTFDGIFLSGILAVLLV